AAACRLRPTPENLDRQDPEIRVASAPKTPVKATKKPGRTASPAFLQRVTAARLLALQLDDFVLDAEFLTLQIVDRLLVGTGTMVFFIDGAIERSMLFSKRLDAIMQRHALPSC